MTHDHKKRRPAEHEPQNSNILVQTKKGEKLPVSRSDSDSVKNAGHTTGLNRAVIDNDLLGPNDSSDQ